LDKGDRISLQLESRKLVHKQVESYEEAIQFVDRFESVRSFSFSEGAVEVVLND
jgi:hypothetical protein